MSLPLPLGIVATDISLGDNEGAMQDLGEVGGKTKNASCSELGDKNPSCSEVSNPRVRWWYIYVPPVVAPGPMGSELWPPGKDATG